MSGRAVKLSNAVMGDGSDREVVWMVSVCFVDGSEDACFEAGIYIDQDEAEDAAASRAALLGLPVWDERDFPGPEVVPFTRPKPTE